MVWDEKPSQTSHLLIIGTINHQTTERKSAGYFARVSIANSSCDLIKVRFGALCGLNQDITGCPTSAKSRHLWSQLIPRRFRPPRGQEFVDKGPDFW
jgi:hypothetical protein